MKQKLEWKKPCVTRVGLDPKQAVLETCAISTLGVAWLITLQGDENFCFYGSYPGTGEACPTSPRGVWRDGTVTDQFNAGS